MTYLLIIGLALYGGSCVWASSWINDMMGEDTEWYEVLFFAVLWPFVLFVLMVSMDAPE